MCCLASDRVFSRLVNKHAPFGRAEADLWGDFIRESHDEPNIFVLRQKSPGRECVVEIGLPARRVTSATDVRKQLKGQRQRRRSREGSLPLSSTAASLVVVLW